MSRALKRLFLGPVIENVFNSMDAHTCILFLPDEEGMLIPAHVVSLSNSINRECKIRSGEGPVGWVWREQKPLNISRFRNDSRVTGYYLKNVEISTFLGIPLSKRMGVLCVDSKTRHHFTAKDEKILANFAHTLSILLEANDVFLQNRLLVQILRWLNTPFNSFEKAVSGLMELLSLEIGFVCRRSLDREFYIVTHVIGKMEKEPFSFLNNKRFSIHKGMGGLAFKKKMDLQMKLDEGDRLSRFIFDPEESIPPMKTMLVLFFPSVPDMVPVEHSVILGGRGSGVNISQEMINALKMGLERRAPWQWEV